MAVVSNLFSDYTVSVSSTKLSAWSRLCYMIYDRSVVSACECWRSAITATRVKRILNFMDDNKYYESKYLCSCDWTHNKI